MRIDQITPLLKYGHKVSNTVLNLQKTVLNMGMASAIYAGAKEEALQVRALDLASWDDQSSVIIYHMFRGSNAAQIVMESKARQKLMYYHHIIPPDHFTDYQTKMYHQKGREQLKFLKDYIDLVITNFKYNERDLNELGYERVMVLPPLINLAEYNREPNAHLLKMYRDDHVNILFVGRISPTNRQEDIINVFNYYHKRINPKSRLFLVGDYWGQIGYFRQLLALIDELQVRNVFITGRVSFTQLLAYYQVAHVFLSMSEYNGSCTSLIEAMHFQVPVIAYDCGAVAEALGEAGQLIYDKDIRETARLVNLLVTDKQKRKEILSRQAQRVADYHPDRVFSAYKEALNNHAYIQIERGSTGEA